MAEQSPSQLQPPVDRGVALPHPLSEVTKFLNRTPATIWRWRKQGWLDVFHIAGKCYVADAALRKFVARAEAGEFSKRVQVPARRTVAPVQVTQGGAG